MAVAKSRTAAVPGVSSELAVAKSRTAAAAELRATRNGCRAMELIDEMAQGRVERVQMIATAVAVAAAMAC